MGLMLGMTAGEDPTYFPGLLETSMGSLIKTQPESQELWLPEMLMQRVHGGGGEGCCCSPQRSSASNLGCQAGPCPGECSLKDKHCNELGVCCP